MDRFRPFQNPHSRKPKNMRPAVVGRELATEKEQEKKARGPVAADGEYLKKYQKVMRQVRNVDLYSWVCTLVTFALGLLAGLYLGFLVWADVS